MQISNLNGLLSASHYQQIRKMKKKKNIVIVNFDQHDGIPAGNDIFYLCLNCRSIIQSYPETYSTCKCGNVFVDVGAGRGGANDISNLLILKIE